MTTFTSKSNSLTIVVKPARYGFSPDGSRQYFEGKRAQFMNGVFRTDDQEIIDNLKAHRDYGVLFVSEDKAVTKEESSKKEEAKKKQERELAKKTEAKATNKKLGAEGGDANETKDPDSEDDIANQFKNEDSNLIP